MHKLKEARKEAEAFQEEGIIEKMVAASKREALKEQAKKEEREADERYLIEYLEREERE